MKYLGLTTLILGLFLFSIISNNLKADKPMIYSEGLNVTEIEKNREEIQKLIRQVLIWSDSNESIELLPVIKENGDSSYFEFDMVKLKSNLDKLKQTGFFASEFIENYNQIILTIDRKLRNNEFDRWLVGDLPTFNFVNEINPWCQCQGYSQEDIDDVEIIKIESKYGELKWKWKAGADWSDFIFRVIKEDNKWKISYLEGFDFNESTK